MRGRHRSWGMWLFVGTVVLALIVARGCREYQRWQRVRAESALAKEHQDLVLVTGYCNCGKCCGWKRKWFGFGEPVYDYGPMKGKPKQIGVTATGTVAKRGTIAADPRVYPFGTRLRIPGFGEGVVEDIGGAIKGRHIDLWFPSHEEAKKWGAQWLKVKPF